MCEEKAAVGLEDAAEREELGEGLTEGGGADAAGLAELASCHGPVGGAENLLDALRGGRTVRSRSRRRQRGVGRGGDAQGKRVSVLVKLEGERGDGRSGAVLDGEGQAVLGAAEIEVAVAPFMLSRPLCCVDWCSRGEWSLWVPPTAHNGRGAVPRPWRFSAARRSPC